MQRFLNKNIGVNNLNLISKKANALPAFCQNIQEDMPLILVAIVCYNRS